MNNAKGTASRGKERTFRVHDQAGMAEALKAQRRGDKAGFNDGMHPQI